MAFFSFAFSAFSSLPALADWRLSCLAVNWKRSVLVGEVDVMAGVEGWLRAGYLQVEESLFEA
jgi:hypothetical protein